MDIKLHEKQGNLFGNPEPGDENYNILTDKVDEKFDKTLFSIMAERYEVKYIININNYGYRTFVWEPLDRWAFCQKKIELSEHIVCHMLKREIRFLIKRLKANRHTRKKISRLSIIRKANTNICLLDGYPQEALASLLNMTLNELLLCLKK